jgi:hypothetical protein
MKMNQRRTGFATRDRVIGDFLRAVGNVRVAFLYRIAVYRSLDDYFRHRLVPLDTVWHIQSIVISEVARKTTTLPADDIG